DMGEIFFATCGTDAIAMAREKRPDMVLLDIEMPGMNGYEVCRAIKSDPNLADLPILFITVRSDMESEICGLDAGAVDFISKPPSPPIVRARVKTHLALKQRTDLLHRIASIDGLTGIANRRAFDTALEQELRRACRNGGVLSLLMIDVDFFKRFNDHYGHPAGDDCLRSIASTLAAVPRRPGDVAARYGGEEFCLILPACDLDNSVKLAESIRLRVSGLQIPHALSDAFSCVTISVGVACFECDAVSHGGCPTGAACDACALVLVKSADGALYEAKRGGRNRVASATMSRDAFTVGHTSMEAS
ncbi:MAG: diguanylate cyclase, partial [Desulfuromonadaceae bacterium]|nr:diguanylate cyclase [Desulfuromonadaceae bacterium]